MAQFIHLADERLARRIERAGLKPHAHCNISDTIKYVFATPVLMDFIISHQWLRELKRTGVRTIVAVQFRIPDDEPVKVGRFNSEHIDTTAAGAVRIFTEHKSGLGLEVLIPRKICAKELTRIYTPPQLVGWRYTPDSKGVRPCGCDYCARGGIKKARIRKAYLVEEAEDLERNNREFAEWEAKQAQKMKNRLPSPIKAVDNI